MTPIGIQLVSVDWGYVAFWSIFGVVIAALFLIVYVRFRGWVRRRDPANRSEHPKI